VFDVCYCTYGVSYIESDLVSSGGELHVRAGSSINHYVCIAAQERGSNSRCFSTKYFA
jgi:hypothetical protein